MFNCPKKEVGDQPRLSTSRRKLRVSPKKRIEDSFLSNSTHISRPNKFGYIDFGGSYTRAESFRLTEADRAKQRYNYLWNKKNLTKQEEKNLRMATDYIRRNRL